jgi:Bacterial PH domain
MVYRTKIDTRIARPLALAIVLPAAAGLAFLIQGEAPAWVVWIFFMPSLGIVVLLSLIGWPVDYDPGASAADGEPILLVRSGLIRYRIPLAQISEVRPSAETSSSPAWSLDRLKVVCLTRSGFHRSLLISPRDRDGFLDELARHANNLERDGNSLVRKDRPRPSQAQS